METQTNNNNTPQNEVDELREQFALFKQRLDQQEIINDRLMRHSMSARISVFTKWSVICDIAGLLLMSLAIPLLHNMGLSWTLGIIIILSIVIELAYNINCHRRLQRLFTEGNDLLTVRRGLLEFKKAERVQLLIALPFIILWLLAFYWQMGVFDGEPTGAAAAGIVSSAIGIVFGLLFCFAFFAWEMHRVNHSIREIDELTEE